MQIQGREFRSTNYI